MAREILIDSVFYHLPSIDNCNKKCHTNLFHCDDQMCQWWWEWWLEGLSKDGIE